MTKTPGESKKRITKQEVLDKFQKNEKTGENTELYMNVGKELEEIGIKYKELTILKENLQKMVNKQYTLGVVLDEYGINETDRSTTTTQMNKFKEMSSRLEETFEEIEKSIEERMKEIKKIEEVIFIIKLIKKS